MNNDTRNLFSDTQTRRSVLALGAFLAIVYLYVIAFLFPPSNMILFTLLIAGQIFLVWQILTYIHTVWNTEKEFSFDEEHLPPVDVFITVAGEPVSIVEATVRAAIAQDYPDFNVYILNDGYVAGKENWREMERLARRLHVQCITRTHAGGAKAGNINHALSRTRSPLVAIFDADHIPHTDFLRRTVGYFREPRVGFVQTPQLYRNKDLNYVTRCAWEQQELFFGPICKGKNAHNAATMCGTNMVIRREALEAVNGMCEESIAEDFVTGLFMHEKGWQSIYVPTVLAEGLAPEDYLSYCKQQHRWARGALDIIFRYRIFFRRGLSRAQKIQYLSSASHFLSGAVILMNALFPLIFLYFGQQPFTVSTMTLAAIFLPYMFTTLYILSRSSGNTFTWNALAFSMGGFGIHIMALWHAATRSKSAFAVTSKSALRGNFLILATAHILYICAAAAGVSIGIAREGVSPAIANNIAWALISCAAFTPAIIAALPQRQRAPARKSTASFDAPNTPSSEPETSDESETPVLISQSRIGAQSLS